ncbi:MAG: tetratricopeptide repeat protein [Deltaproteobacteria bacterium]|nr:tetratricopeptide repeat protein [Deltaproteobacteria bacterium]
MNSNLYEMLQQASTLQKEEHPEAAATTFQKIADIFFDQQRFIQAVAAYQKASTLLNHKNAEILFNLGQSFEKLQKAYSAYEHYEMAFDLHFSNHTLDQALDIALKMSLLQPEEYRPYEKIATIHLILGHDQKAYDGFLQAALKAHTKNLFLPSLRYLFYAFKLFPTQKEIWVYLTQWLEIAHGSQDLHVQTLKKLTEGAPEIRALPMSSKPSFSWEQEMKDAKLLEEENLNEAAKLIYQKILKDDPSFPPALKALEALETLEAKQKATPSPEDLIRSLEEDLGIQEDLSPVHLRLTPASQPLDLQTKLDLAIAYKELGLIDDALALLEEALEAKALSTNLKFNLLHLKSLCLNQNKHYLETILLLEKSLPELETVSEHLRLALLYALSDAYEKSGNLKKALGGFRKIEKEDKTYRDIVERIKKLRGIALND